MTARFITSHAKVSIVPCYAPTNEHDDADKDAFYQHLQDVVDKIPRHDILIVMGDLNAQIGGSRSGFEHVLDPHAFGNRTDNGDRFTKFCAMNSMKIGSSLFDHKNIYKITWTSNDHTTKTQIEHIASGPSWRMPCLQDVRVYQRADVCSDHHLSIAKMKIKLKRQKRKASMLKMFDTSKLKDSATEAQFETLLRNRLSALADTPPGTPEWWEKLKEAMAAAGEEILGYKKSLKEVWISDNTWKLISAGKKPASDETQCKLR